MIERVFCIVLMIGFVIGFSVVIFYPELLPIAFDAFNNLFYNR